MSAEPRNQTLSRLDLFADPLWLVGKAFLPYRVAYPGLCVRGEGQLRNRQG